MLNEIFSGLFEHGLSSVGSIGDFLICIVAALLAGLILSAAYTYRSRYSKSFITSLALLPVVVSVVIMMVNGNIGTGVAVAGAFNLVRFRSAPGNAEEISGIFISMCTGLIMGMGYIGYGLSFTLIMAVISLLFKRLDFGTKKNAGCCKSLKLLVSDDVNYEALYNDILNEYSDKWELEQVKLNGQGHSLRLSYLINLRQPAQERELIEKLRACDDKAEITLAQSVAVAAEL